jgi:hypothetical protein
MSHGYESEPRGLSGQASFARDGDAFPKAKEINVAIRRKL